MNACVTSDKTFEPKINKTLMHETKPNRTEPIQKPNDLKVRKQKKNEEINERKRLHRHHCHSLMYECVIM